MKAIVKIKKHTVRRAIILISLVILTLAALLFPRFVSPAAAEVYSGRIFPYIAMPANLVSGLVQTSVTEAVVVVGAPTLLVLVIIFTVKVIKKALLGRGAREYVYKVSRNALVIALVMSIIFSFMHALNYRRYPARQLMELYGGDYTFDDYEKALNWAYLGMISARSDLGEDFAGVAHMNNSFENNVSYANMLVSDVLGGYGINVSNEIIRAKPVALSHYWSMFGIVGMYDMFLGESNINTDYIDITEFPITVCHEILHAKGFARETDCNMLAAICCIRSSRPDFRYAGYYQIFWSLYPIVTEYAASEGRELYEYTNDKNIQPVFADTRARMKYWDNIHHESDRILDMLGIDLEQIGENANDAFLEANGQEGGTDTYEVPYSVYVDFYKQYVEETDA